MPCLVSVLVVYSLGLFTILPCPAYRGLRTLSASCPFFCSQIQVGRDASQWIGSPLRPLLVQRQTNRKHGAAGGGLNDSTCDVRSKRDESDTTSWRTQLPTTWHAPAPTDRSIGRPVTSTCTLNTGNISYERFDADDMTDCTEWCASFVKIVCQNCCSLVVAG